MARNFYTDIDLQGNQLIDAVLDQTVSNANAAGKIAYDSTLNRAVVHDGASAKMLATVNDVLNVGADQGNHDASGGALPTTAPINSGGEISKGDNWTISVAGTIAGVGAVKVGDVLRSLVDNPSSASDWSVTPFPIDFANSFENGLSVVGGKAVLGGTLTKTLTKVDINGKYLSFADAAQEKGLVLDIAGDLYVFGDFTNSAYWSANAGDIEAKGNAVSLFAVSKMVLSTPKVTEADASLANGQFLKLVDKTSGEVEFAAGTVALLDSKTDNLAAGVAKAFTLANLTTVRGFNVFDSAGNEITSNVVASKATNVVTLTASVALTGVTVEAWGV